MIFTTTQTRVFLEQTLVKAQQALELENYPIGCVVVDTTGKVVAEAINLCTSGADVTAHAEIVAIRELGDQINKHTPGDRYLFSSLEPCFGCSFFIARTNIRSIYSALKDVDRGGISELKSQAQFTEFFQKIEIFNQPFPDLAKRSKSLLKKYYQSKGKNATAQLFG